MLRDDLQLLEVEAPTALGEYRVVWGDDDAWVGTLVVERDVRHWFLFAEKPDAPSSADAPSSKGATMRFSRVDAEAGLPRALRFELVGEGMGLGVRRALEKREIAFRHVIVNARRSQSQLTQEEPSLPPRK